MDFRCVWNTGFLAVAALTVAPLRHVPPISRFGRQSEWALLLNLNE